MTLRRWLGAALAWTGAQHAAYFASAWLVSALAGADAFGALGQALALGMVGSLAATARLEYAAQLQPREALAVPLFALAARLGWAVGAMAVLLAALAWRMGWAPAWALAGALAVTPLALLQVLAARRVRAGQVAAAAALRAGPALVMLPLQAAAGAAGWATAMAWTVPLAAWLCCATALARGAPAAPSTGWRRQRRVARARWPFVRAEWPSLVLNAAANHGQVLVVGALAGDAAAGAMALALRMAMLPVSLLGPALSDALRARVVAAGTRAAARALLARWWPRVVGASALVHAVAAVALPWVGAWFFAPQGAALVAAAQALLLLGALRLAVSPFTFLLAWRGWFAINLAGQALLLAVAVGAAVWGVPRGGVPTVAWAYALCAGGVYLGYAWASVRAVRGDTPGF